MRTYINRNEAALIEAMLDERYERAKAIVEGREYQPVHPASKRERTDRDIAALTLRDKVERIREEILDADDQPDTEHLPEVDYLGGQAMDT